MMTIKSYPAWKSTEPQMLSVFSMTKPFTSPNAKTIIGKMNISSGAIYVAPRWGIAKTRDVTKTDAVAPKRGLSFPREIPLNHNSSIKAFAKMKTRIQGMEETIVFRLTPEAVIPSLDGAFD